MIHPIILIRCVTIVIRSCYRMCSSGQVKVHVKCSYSRVVDLNWTLANNSHLLWNMSYIINGIM